jgi:UDP-N-acetylmuramyl pentapeptide phosphotransferase/UDP-N-acetylglucosamine-1-phosphate transferase
MLAEFSMYKFIPHVFSLAGLFGPGPVLGGLHDDTIDISKIEKKMTSKLKVGVFIIINKHI